MASELTNQNAVLDGSAMILNFQLGDHDSPEPARQLTRSMSAQAWMGCRLHPTALRILADGCYQVVLVTIADSLFEGSKDVATMSGDRTDDEADDDMLLIAEIAYRSQVQPEGDQTYGAESDLVGVLRRIPVRRTSADTWTQTGSALSLIYADVDSACFALPRAAMEHWYRLAVEANNYLEDLFQADADAAEVEEIHGRLEDQVGTG